MLSVCLASVPSMYSVLRLILVRQSSQHPHASILPVKQTQAKEKECVLSGLTVPLSKDESAVMSGNQRSLVARHGFTVLLELGAGHTLPSPKERDKGDAIRQEPSGRVSCGRMGVGQVK